MQSFFAHLKIGQQFLVLEGADMAGRGVSLRGRSASKAYVACVGFVKLGREKEREKEVKRAKDYM